MSHSIVERTGTLIINIYDSGPVIEDRGKLIKFFNELNPERDVELIIPHITYFNSELLGWILELHKRTKQNNFKFTLTLGSENQMRFFKNLNMTNVVNIRIEQDGDSK